MHLRDREPVPAADPTEPAPHPFEGATVMVVPAPLPDLQTAFSRRAALFGPVLGAAAALAVSPPAKAHVALPAADARLVALVDELQTGNVALNALAKSDPRDCEDIPGYPAAEARLHAIVSELYDVRAESMAGVVAMAKALQISFVRDDYQTTGDLAFNLAEDILQMTGAQS